MVTLTDEQIKEIAEQLDCGFTCFWNKENGELIFIPDSMKYPDMDTEVWADELEKLDSNPEDYREIEPLEPSDSFKIMKAFVYTLNDSNSLKNKLIAALNKRHPFRNFKFLVDNSGEYRQKWFDFKNQELIQRVRDRIQELDS